MNDYNLKGRRAIVTGGAQGFGYAITKRFIESGAEVIIWDIDPKMSEKAVKDLNNSNLSSNIVDVSNFKEVEKTIAEICHLKNCHKTEMCLSNILDIDKLSRNLATELIQMQGS